MLGDDPIDITVHVWTPAQLLWERRVRLERPPLALAMLYEAERPVADRATLTVWVLAQLCRRHVAQEVDWHDRGGSPRIEGLGVRAHS